MIGVCVCLRVRMATAEYITVGVPLGLLLVDWIGKSTECGAVVSQVTSLSSL